MKRRLIIAASLFVFNLSSGFAAESIPFSPQPPEIHAESLVLMDYTTGQILTAGNEHQQRNPASLTKLMTGYAWIALSIVIALRQTILSPWGVMRGRKIIRCLSVLH